jgi:dienelactone hydrolase
MRSAADWRAYAAGVRRRFVAAVTHPALVRRATWRERCHGEKKFDGFSIENLWVESLPGCWMNVTVWKPDPARWPPPWPAIVTPVGHNGKYFASEQHPPQVFAANGCLSVSFDPPGFGEKARGNNHFEDGVRGYVAGQNPLVFFLADALRAVDYVLARPDVNGGRGVAMTGVSGGGFTSIGCAILDPRITAIGPSCYGLPDEVHPVRNGYAACPETLWVNRFADGLGLTDLLIGARFVPMLLMAGRRDAIFTTGPMRQLTRAVCTAYAAVGRAGACRLFVDDCGHEYTPAQARAFVAWLRRWQGGPSARRPVEMPRKLLLLSENELRTQPPVGLTMAAAAAAVVRTRRRVTDAAAARRALARLIPDWAAHRRRGLRAVAGGEAKLWGHTLQELSLRDGPAWELPATALRPADVKGGALVFFDDRGRWTDLQQWGWLNRAAGVFSRGDRPRSILTVDLPGWGDTRPLPGPFDIVGWGGVDRWTGYVSAATGESIMALRLRDAVRTVDFVQREWGIPAARIIVGGHGLGATIAGLAACLHGKLGGALLLEPLAEFSHLATAAKPTRPHDAYFPGILGAADLPEALTLQLAPVLVVGPRNAAGRLLGAGARRVFPARHIRVLPRECSPAREPAGLDWLRAHA